MEAERSVVGAMLLDRQARRSALAMCNPADFASPLWRDAAAAMVQMDSTGEVIDAISVAAELRHHDGEVTALTQLLEAQNACPAISHAERYAEIVQNCAARRRLITLAVELSEMGYANSNVSEMLDFAKRRLTETSLLTPDDPFDELTTFDQFRQRVSDTPPEWAIENVLAVRERCLIVAPEGAGKGVLMRQIASAIGAGLHPFTQRPHPRLPVLYLDLENPERVVADQINMSFEGGSHLIGDPAAVDAWMLHREAGMNLRTTADQVYLERAMQIVKPKILCIGPIYKAAQKRSMEGWEEAAVDLLRVLDDFRVRFNCALIMEHHAPRGSGIRELVPFGSTAWQRWPEFGLKLEPDGADRQGRPLALNIGRFRGDRTDGQWPDRLVRGEGRNLPWIPQLRPR
jgi:replicative DNA helicase